MQKFCQPYEGIVDFSIKHADVNDEITNIVDEIKSNASLFFIDPGGIKDLKKETIGTIVNKKGPNDLLLNYICGTNRLTGKIRKMLEQKAPKEKIYKHLDILNARFKPKLMLDCFFKTDKEVLSDWVDEILKDSELKKFVSSYPMIHQHRNEAVYYLLFACRVPVAKKIIDDIFSKLECETYNGQIKMDFIRKKKFDLPKKIN